eukprot:1385926-Prorocentrum_lima.AAC.1
MPNAICIKRKAGVLFALEIVLCLALVSCSSTATKRDHSGNSSTVLALAPLVACVDPAAAVALPLALFHLLLGDMCIHQGKPRQ